MAINPYLLCEALTSHTSKKITSSRYLCTLSYVTIYIPGIEVNEHTIYLIHKDAPFPESQLDKGTWLVGESQFPSLQQMKADIIAMPDEYPIQKLYDQICHIMDIYNQWEITLQNALANGCDAHELCKIGVPFMGNPMMITADDGEILGVGMIRGDDYSKHLREQETDYLSSQRVQKVYRNAMQFLNQREPVFYYLDEEEPTLMFHIFVENEHKGVLYVDAWNKQFNDGDYTRICIFGKYLEFYMKRLESSQYKPLNYFRRELSALVSHEQGDRKVIEYYLGQFGWKESDAYLCGIISELGEEEGMESETLCGEYEKIFGKGIITFQDSQIYMLCNMTTLGCTYDEIKLKLQNINQKFHVSSGISTVFTGFFECRVYFSQARVAYEVGHKIRENEVIYGFSEYRIAYLLRQGVKRLPLSVILTQNLYTLYAYDRENQTDYLDTFGTYSLCNQNVSATAEQLFMHRSTLKYHLKKMKEIAGSELFEDRENGLVSAMICRSIMWEEERQKRREYHGN